MCWEFQNRTNGSLLDMSPEGAATAHGGLNTTNLGDYGPLRLSLRYAVDLARDGQEALEYLERRGAFAGRPEGDPAVVLMDVRMPRLNGIETLGRIKANPSLRKIPMVMLT